MGSTRLPGKVLLPLGECRVLGWAARRCSAAERVDDLYVTTGRGPENEAITEWCRRAGHHYSTGPEDDLLERHRMVAEAAEADVLVRVTADCPFLPAEEVDRVVAAHREHGAAYTTNHTDRMPIGTAVDVLDADLLEELSELGDTHPVVRLREDPDSWDVHYTDSDELAAFGTAHVAVDTPADYWSLIDAVDAVGSDPLRVARWMAKD
jgi:spore coat polysaccharide biosynthesis protein SpsF